MVVFLLNIASFGQTPFGQVLPVHYRRRLLAGVGIKATCQGWDVWDPQTSPEEGDGWGRAHGGFSLCRKSHHLVFFLPPQKCPNEGSFPRVCLQPARTGRGKSWTHSSQGPGSRGDGGGSMGWDGRDREHLTAPRPAWGCSGTPGQLGQRPRGGWARADGTEPGTRRGRAPAGLEPSPAPRPSSPAPAWQERTAEEGRARPSIKSPRGGRGAGGTPRRAQSSAAGAVGAGPWSSTSRPPRRWSRR